MQTIAFCEIEPYCQAVLRKHWPNVPIFGDVTKLTSSDIDAIGGCNVICGGFPCQDISAAGKGAGIEGARSGLWREYARLIGELKPRYVIVENVAALRSRGLGTVLRDLAALGYDAEWHCIPASAIGAQHRRDRLWIVAYPNAIRHRATEFGAAHYESAPNGPSRTSAHSAAWREAQSEQLAAETLANSECSRLEGRNGQIVPSGFGARLAADIRASRSRDFGGWEAEPALGRVADGFPGRVDQLRALGNAVVPQIPEIIGRAIIEFEANN